MWNKRSSAIRLILVYIQSDMTFVVQDVRTYEATQQTIALLRILAIGQKLIEREDHVDGGEFFAELNELDRQEKLRRCWLRCLHIAF